MLNPIAIFANTSQSIPDSFLSIQLELRVAVYSQIIARSVRGCFPRPMHLNTNQFVKTAHRWRCNKLDAKGDSCAQKPASYKLQKSATIDIGPMRSRSITRTSMVSIIRNLIINFDDRSNKRSTFLSSTTEIRIVMRKLASFLSCDVSCDQMISAR